ncbi:putative fungal-specific transcription factor [Fusarium acuminatum]|uniref:Fungal-specific transcription factor n=1 Tax=Fusarium acuminatum TaxID=5515 RepID=A0ABZ2WF59_9HYPO
MEQARSTRDGPVTKRRRLDPQPAITDLSSAENIVDSAAEGSWNSSSTIRLVEEAFQHHEAISPEGPETSALSSATWAQPYPKTFSNSGEDVVCGSLGKLLSNHVRRTHEPQNSCRVRSSTIEQELSSLLPGLEPATILVDNYFDRIHWFMLLFHQDSFRKKLQELYVPSFHPSGQSTEISGRVGFVVVLLAVLATSLHHISEAQKQRLQSHGIEPQSLKEGILANLKLKFLDVVSLGSLEAVQFSVLLGSYYLYHGEPEIAWPMCGSGLRIAQALNLHRKVSSNGSRDRALDQTIGDRKRAWWAVYEIETFCSMLYGFPLGFSDSDCDVEALDPFDEYSRSTSEARLTRQPTLLFYKCSMSDLSAIVKSTLIDLYGARRSGDQQNSCGPKSLINRVTTLNKRLSDWNRSLTPELRFDISRAVPDSHTGSSKASERAFEDHIFRLQALALKLAYENARILIHRPLLSFKMVCSSSISQSGALERPDPFRLAMHECRDAALEISQVASTPYLREASETYAIAFVSLHLLTAGVTLCISISLDALSVQSFESKLGMRQLMQVQTMLKDKSIVASQGLDIMRKLMSLVMAKEIDAMFETEPPSTTTEHTRTSIPAYVSRDEDLMVNSGEDDPEQNPASIQTDVLTDIGLDLQTLGNTNVITAEANNMTYEGQNVDFCENNLLNDALLEYEQGMSNSESGNGEIM